MLPQFLNIKTDLFAVKNVLESELLQNELKLVERKETLNSIPNVLMSRMVDFRLNDFIKTSLCE